MVSQSAVLRFLLNDRQIETEVSTGRLLLDYLRRERHTGTKEGCREGDCGACTVLVGELDGERVSYRPVTSCLMPLAEVHGKHVVTIEGLQLETLTPIQQAIVDQGASQCGFCTPGIVMSLTALLLQDEIDFEPAMVRRALSGHLCRCTGYRSLEAGGGEVRRVLGATSTAWTLQGLVDHGHLPAWFVEAPRQLQRLGQEAAPPTRPATGSEDSRPWRIAGGTDLYVQHGDALAQSAVDVLDRYPEMKGIHRANGHLRLGALTTFEEVMHHPRVLELVPDMAEYMHWIASWQVRNRATLGGNLVNASPIGDMTILLLALEVELAIRRGDECRRQALTGFYKGYKELELGPDEVITEILLPMRDPATRVHFEKVAKRKTLDIASVNSAARFRLQDGLIAEVGLAAGGVAPVPLFLSATCKGLIGRAVERDTVDAACRLAQEEISPISDVRGSAQYKRLALHQQIIAHFCRLFPQHLDVEAFL